MAPEWILIWEGSTIVYMNLQSMERSKLRPDLSCISKMALKRVMKKHSMPSLIRVLVKWALSGEPIATLQCLPSDSIADVDKDIMEIVDSRQSRELAFLCQDPLVTPKTTSLHELGLVDGAMLHVMSVACDITLALNEGMVRILQGMPMKPVRVGDLEWVAMIAQVPPGQGDAWEVTFFAEACAYDVLFVGGSNSAHGILSVFIDDEHVGQVDQFSSQGSIMHCVLHWSSRSAGEHILRGGVQAKDVDSTDFWICLSQIVFQPVDGANVD